MTESFWFYLVEIERILSLQHFSKVKNFRYFAFTFYIQFILFAEK